MASISFAVNLGSLKLFLSHGLAALFYGRLHVTATHSAAALFHATAVLRAHSTELGSLGGRGASLVEEGFLLGFVELFLIFFLTGVLHDLLNLDHDLLVALFLRLIVRAQTIGVNLGGMVLAHSVEPRVETNLVVHHGQERVHTGALVGQIVENVFAIAGLSALFFGLQSQSEDLKLGEELYDL